MTFGEKLDEAIVMRGMKQREFAKAVGTSEVSISRYISNERNPKIQTAVKMANILNVSLDWLCGTASEKKSDGIALYQQGWNDAIDAMQNAKFVSVAEQTEPQKKMCANCKHIKKHNGKLADYVCDRKGSIVTNPYDKECDEMWEQAEPNSSEIPNNCEPKICDTCRYYNSNIPCGSTPSACKEADKFAEEFVDGLKKLKPKVEPQTSPTISKMEQVDKDINVRSKDEPQTDVYDYKGNGKWERSE